MQEKIIDLFKHSLLDFLHNDYNQMCKDSSERAKVHRIAHYLECNMKTCKLLRDYIVDCEYNRVIIGNQLTPKSIPKDFLDEKEHKFLPDLIVHKRNKKENLFCCEFKNKYNCTNDLRKIKFLMTDSKFSYKVGAFVILSKLKDNDYINNLTFYTKKHPPTVSYYNDKTEK